MNSNRFVRAGLGGALPAFLLLCTPLPAHGASLSFVSSAADGRSGCAAAWLPAERSTLRLLALDASQAVIAAGDLLLAQLDFDPPALRAAAGDAPARPAASAPAAARVARDGDAWSIAARLVHDSACTLILDATLSPSPADPTMRAIATAWRGHAAARTAWRDARREEAAAEATRAVRRLLDLPSAHADDALAAQIGELGAFAAERLLEAARAPQARALLDELGPLMSRLPAAHPSALRTQAAASRALGFAERYAESLALRQETAAAVDATFGADSDEGLDRRLRAVNLHAVLGDARAARALLDDLEPRVMRLRPPGDALRVQVRRARSTTASLAGEAAAGVEAAAALRDELAAAFGEDDRRAVDAGEVLARALVQAGRHQDALLRAAQVLQQRQRSLGATHPQSLEAAELIGVAGGQMGRHASAAAILAWVAARAAEHDAGSRLAARTRYQHAYWVNRDPESPPAPALMRAAYEGVRRAYGPVALDTLGASLDYAESQMRAGDLDAACALLGETLATLRALPRGDPTVRALAAGLRGRCLLLRAEAAPAASSARAPTPSSTRASTATPDAVAADLQQARALLADAWDSLSAGDGPASLRALPQLSSLAVAHLRLGDRATAKAMLLRFVALSERQRAQSPPGSTLRDASFGQWVAEQSTRAGYRTLAWLHAQDGELDAALRVADLARDRRLRDRFAERAWRDLPLGAAARDELDALLARRQALDEQLAAARDHADIGARIAREAERTQLVHAIDALLRSVPAPAEPLAPTIARLRARLAPGAAFVMVQPAGDRWWALVVTRRDARAVDLGAGGALDVAAPQWLRVLRGAPARAWRRADGGLVAGFARPAGVVGRPLRGDDFARVLGGTLLAPLRRATGEATRWTVALDDALTGVPLEALPLGGAAAVNALTLDYTPSASTWLADGAQRPRPPRELLALGGIDYAAVAWPDHGAFARLTWDTLPGTRDEIDRVAARFDARRSERLLGADATVQALIERSRNGRLARYRYVHLAAHGHVPATAPERSAIVLARRDADSATDGYLTAAQLAGLSMAADLVTLSACDSGVGRHESGQGLLGLAFAVLAAGNRAALLSLWPVADDTTAAFMAAFYGRLRGGRPPADALAATKREFARSGDPRRRDTRTWAAFVLYGR